MSLAFSGQIHGTSLSTYSTTFLWKRSLFGGLTFLLLLNFTNRLV